MRTFGGEAESKRNYGPSCDCVWPMNFSDGPTRWNIFYDRIGMIAIARERRRWHTELPDIIVSSVSGTRRRSPLRIFQKFECFHFSFDVAASRAYHGGMVERQFCFFLRRSFAQRTKVEKTTGNCNENEAKNTVCSRRSEVHDDNGVDNGAYRQTYTLHMQIALHEEHTDSYKLIIQPRNAHNRLKV